MEIGKLLGRGARASVYSWGDDKVIKVFDPGYPAEDVASEFFTSKRVADAGINAPAAHTQMTIDGRKAIVYDRVEGPTLQDYLIRHPWSVRGWAIRMAELHADIHAHTLSEASTRKAVLRQRIERQRKLSESVRDAVLGEIESLPEGQSVCHGDFHPGNILLSPRGPVVIDWPDAYIGDPASDVARTTLLLLLAPLHAKGARRLYARLLLRRIYKHYLRRYLQITGVGYDRIKAWLPVLAAARLAEGFSEEEELLTVIIAVG